MPWKQIDWAQVIPFLLVTGQSNRLSVARMIEAFIIAGVTASVVMYAAQKVLSEQVKDLRADLHKVERQLEQFQKDFYRPVFENKRSEQ